MQLYVSDQLDLYFLGEDPEVLSRFTRLPPDPMPNNANLGMVFAK
jgi:hypothetical protein